MLGNAILLNILMLIPVLTCALPAARMFGLEGTSFWALLIAISYFLFDAFLRNFFGAIIANEKMKYIAVITLVNVVAEFLLVVTVIRLDLGFLYLFIASMFASVLGVLSSFFVFKKKFTLPRFRPTLRGLWFLLKPSLPLTVSLFLINAFLYVDVFVLKFMASNSDVSLFQAPHKILTRMQVLPMAFFIALLPVFSRLANSRETAGEFGSLYARSFKMSLIVALPISIIGVAFSKRLVLLLFGDEFTRAGLSLSILLCSFPFLCLTTLNRYLLISLKKQKLVMYSDALCVLSNLVLDLLLVPRFGYVGASFGTLSALFIQALVNHFFLMDHLKGAPLHETFFAPVLAALTLAVVLFGSGYQDNLLMLPAALVLYIGSLFIFRGFSPDEREFMKKIMGSKLNSMRTPR